MHAWCSRMGYGVRGFGRAGDGSDVRAWQVAVATRQAWPASAVGAHGARCDGGHCFARCGFGESIRSGSEDRCRGAVSKDGVTCGSMDDHEKLWILWQAAYVCASRMAPQFAG